MSPEEILKFQHTRILISESMTKQNTSVFDDDNAKREILPRKTKEAGNYTIYQCITNLSEKDDCHTISPPLTLPLVCYDD